MNERNMSLKDKVWGHFKDIQAVFLATDPNYTLLEIVIKEVEYLKPGGLKVEKISV